MSVASLRGEGGLSSANASLSTQMQDTARGSFIISNHIYDGPTHSLGTTGPLGIISFAPGSNTPEAYAEASDACLQLMGLFNQARDTYPSSIQSGSTGAQMTTSGGQVAATSAGQIGIAREAFATWLEATRSVFGDEGQETHPLRHRLAEITHHSPKHAIEAADALMRDDIAFVVQADGSVVGSQQVLSYARDSERALQNGGDSTALLPAASAQNHDAVTESSFDRTSSSRAFETQRLLPPGESSAGESLTSRQWLWPAVACGVLGAGLVASGLQRYCSTERTSTGGLTG